MNMLRKLQALLMPAPQTDELHSLVVVPIEEEFNTPLMRERRDALRRARQNEASNRYLWRDCQ